MTERTTCRICGNADLKTIADFGEVFMSTFVKKKGDDIGKYPLVLVHCGGCDLLQLKHTVDLETMYAKQYWYKSGINEKIVNDLKDIVDKALQEVNIKAGDVFLDIGANDGTLLSFVPDTFTRVGVEPATNLIEELKGKCDAVIPYFWSHEIYRVVAKKAKIITAIGMFYDSEDPNLFVGDVKKSLDESGVFIAQMMTLRPMIEKNDFGNICHEHIEYYSYKALKTLFERNGLEIYKVEENDINGGSYRLYARHFTNGSIDVNEPETSYSAFIERLEKNRKETVDFIRKAVAEGKNVYGYGASTKGNSILQWYGLTKDDIVAVADRNPKKHGLFTVGTYIPIVSEDEARLKADYLFILPWGFTSEFIKREEDYLKRGGKMIVSTPEFKVYGLT